jgi:hypothetical protein
VLPLEADSSIFMLSADEKPDIQYADISGMDIQKQAREGGMGGGHGHPEKGHPWTGPHGMQGVQLCKSFLRES